MAHMINNAVCRMVAEVDDTITSVTSLVKYFKVTGLNCALPSSLRSNVSTRWNTVYYMLSSLISNWDDVIKILISKNEQHRIQNLRIETLKVILTL